MKTIENLMWALETMPNDTIMLDHFVYVARQSVLSHSVRALVKMNMFRARRPLTIREYVGVAIEFCSPNARLLERMKA